jgi:hypothetical protein
MNLRACQRNLRRKRSSRFVVGCRSRPEEALDYWGDHLVPLTRSTSETRAVALPGTVAFWLACTVRLRHVGALYGIFGPLILHGPFFVGALVFGGPPDRLVYYFAGLT